MMSEYGFGFGDYDEDRERIQEDNDHLLEEFANSLQATGLSELTIDKHVGNVSFFINNFLLFEDEDEIEARYSWRYIDRFLGSYFIRKAMWASVTTVKQNATSFKKFYKFLYEHGDITADELELVKEIIKEGLPRWIDQIQKYDDPEYDYFGQFDGWGNFLNPEVDTLSDGADDIESSELLEDNKIFSVLERLDTMSEEEVMAAFEDPEIAVWYLALRRKPVHDLKSLLRNLTVEELRIQAEAMQIEKFSSMKKSLLVDSIYNVAMDENLFFAIANAISSDEEINLIHDIMTSDTEYYVRDKDFQYRIAAMLIEINAISVYFDGNDLMLIPIDELKPKYPEFLAILLESAMHGGEYESDLEELDDYACAAANLYGVIAFDDFMDIYSAQTGNDFTKKQVRKKLIDLIKDYDKDEETAGYSLRGDVLFSDDLDDLKKNEIHDLLQISQSHPIVILPREEFLKYADWFYVEETEAYMEFIEYVTDNSGVKHADKMAILIASEICNEFRKGTPMSEIFDILKIYGIELANKKETEAVAALLTRLKKTIRVWGNNGAPENLLN
jgi:hypothetical protein